jgi:hypothetical protein
MKGVWTGGNPAKVSAVVSRTISGAARLFFASIVLQSSLVSPEPETPKGISALVLKSAIASISSNRTLSGQPSAVGLTSAAGDEPDFTDEPEEHVPSEISLWAKQYWDDGEVLNAHPDTGAGVAARFGKAPARRERKEPKNKGLCPPDSLPSKKQRCVCRIGFGCTGSFKNCQVGVSNRIVGDRIEGWLPTSCPQCRCDPLDCKKKRHDCGKS